MHDNLSLTSLVSGPGMGEYPGVGLFSIEDHENEKIYVHCPIDRERTPSFMVKSRPIFQMLTVGLDQENTPNSQVFYSLISQTPLLQSRFWVTQISGEILPSGCLDYETAPLFTLLIRVRDVGGPQLSFTAAVHVTVQEDNNHRPAFTQQNINVTSSQPLDYETVPARKLVTSVENEERLVSCEGGKLRKPAETGAVSVEAAESAFHPRTFIVSEEDGARPGSQLGIFNATDPYRISNRGSYELLHDPANWVTVDEDLGAVTARKQIAKNPLTRGLPPQTDGTLMLFLSDINDNTPML
ncbi:LOW QUALITY PROTEIN: cadherin-like protein 26 [Dugong dugon]